MAVKPIPDGYHSVTAYLIVRGAAQAIDFYQRASPIRSAISGLWQRISKT